MDQSCLFWIIWVTCGRCFEKGKFGPIFSPNLDQTCLFEQFKYGPNLPFDTWSKISKRKKVDQTCLFEATPHVILDSFKHFSGPKYKTLGILWNSQLQLHLLFYVMKHQITIWAKRSWFSSRKIFWSTELQREPSKPMKFPTMQK